ncbi:hypothetical protein J2X36_004411 [Methylobacterium sp. BE186]|uniref:hypothetical protein n=1 Tax=Methylobacterium sp. BE186 TaxID=2817715 RepID=UPI002863959D|nr:hypothetical protein [Methylobacterium sp. BE186]MDR7039635.1 hypothetical protein [Methylobacterium sp. BE186]
MAPKPAFILQDQIESLPNSELGRQRRCVLALAAYGARDDEIGAAVGLDPEALVERHAEDLTRGRSMLGVNIRLELLRAAMGDGRPWSLSAAIYALRHFLSTPSAPRGRRG